MNRQEAQEFLKKHLLILVKDKDGKAQYPYKSINAHKQISERLLQGLVTCNECGNTGRSYPTLQEPDGAQCMNCLDDDIFDITG